jgi:hypothetical protein
MSTMGLWLRLSATFHEHPKMLAVRRAAGSRADSAELGWYRLLMAAKRYGRWTFASEEHLVHVAGPYYRFVDFYREARLLDDLTVHDGDSYNASKTPAERKEEQRERDKVSRTHVTAERDMPRDTNVTLQTDRQTDKETDRQPARVTGYPSPHEDFDALDVYHELTGYRPWGAFSGDALRGMIGDYTDPVVQAGMRAEYERNGDRNDLLKRLQARLARDAERLKRERPAKPRRQHSDPYDDPAFQAERRRLAGLSVVDGEAAS